MIWQYFNGNRISPSSTHSCLFYMLTTISLSLSLHSFSLLLEFSPQSPSRLNLHLPQGSLTILSSLLFLDSPRSHSSTSLYPLSSLLSSHFSIHSPPQFTALSPTSSHCFLYILLTLLFSLPPPVFSLHSSFSTHLPLHSFSFSCFSSIPLLLSLCCCSCACLGCR